MAGETQILYGRRACQAVFERRSQDIRRIYFSRDQAARLGGMLAWAASRRIIYRELGEEELRKVAHSTHHEGLVLATEPLRYHGLGGALEEPAGDPLGGGVNEGAIPGSFEDGSAQTAAGIATEAVRWMALDRVENPHNLGAILRTCAFLDVEALLAGGAEPGEKVNGAALRVAEGGAEAVALYAARDPAPHLAEFAGRGFAVIGLETGGEPMRAAEFSGQPWVLVAGHEQEGLSAATRRACTAVRGIEGTGAVSSLNVSVAVGIALSILTGKTARKAPATARPPRPAPRQPAPRRKARPADVGRPSKKLRSRKQGGKAGNKGKGR